MRNLWLGVLLLPALAFAADPVTVDKEVVCDKASVMIEYLYNKHKEQPVWIGNAENSKFAIMANPETNTWSFVQLSTEKNVACLIDSGTGFIFKVPGLGT